MSRLMPELRISVEQERICLRHLDSVSPSQLSPRYSGHEWLSVWIWKLSVEGGKRESGGGLCVSLSVEMSARHSKMASMQRFMSHLQTGRG